MNDIKISEETLSDIASRGLITKYEKEQIIKALKLQTEVKRRFIEARDVYNEDHISPEHKQHAMDMATTFQGVLEATGNESD